jgi:hypothetical protein
MHALGRQTLLTKHAGAVGRRERHDDELAAPDALDGAADIFHDADRLMSHALTILVRSAVIGPEIAAADAGADDADHRVGRILDGRIRDVLDANVVGLVHDGRAHVSLPRLIHCI